MLSQMEEAEQRRLRACGLDYIGLAMQITVKAANLKKYIKFCACAKNKKNKIKIKKTQSGLDTLLCC